jgi:YtkA-like
MDGRHALLLSVAAVALAAAGCGGQAAEPTAPALVFPGAPALTVASASGQLNIDVWWSPLQPTVGYDAAQLAIDDASGAPVAGLTVTIVPFMPAHGHGASVAPTVSETAPGIYVATPLDFFMAGHWELMTAMSRVAGDAASAGSAGAIDDSAEPTVDVP